ncbi:MAG: tetratricopeptide repeat protein [Syntrophomonadaceae bacterium]|jgi:tetratricopeptide (TPR) repeat protein
MLDGMPVNNLLKDALERFQKRDISGVLDKLNEAVEVEPDNIEAINLMGSCHYVLGNFEKAEACWNTVISLEPSNQGAAMKLAAFNSPSFRFWLKRFNEAVSRVENRDYEGAKAILRILLKENDGFVIVYQLLGLCYLATSDKGSAIKTWKKGLEIDVANPSLLSYINSSSSLVKNLAPNDGQGQYVKKAGWLGKSSWVWGISAALFIALLVQAGLFVKSSKASKATIEEMKSKIHVLSNQVQEQANFSMVPDQNNEVQGSGQDTDPSPDLEEVNYNPGQEDQFYSQGYSAYMAGNWEQAIENLGAVVQMQTGSYMNREALYYLGRTHYLIRDYKNAEKYYSQYLNEFKDSNYYDDSFYYLGCTYYQMGNLEKAREVFDGFQKAFPLSGYNSTEIFRSLMGS